jgi:hypothetical protein
MRTSRPKAAKDMVRDDDPSLIMSCSGLALTGYNSIKHENMEKLREQVSLGEKQIFVEL